MIGLVTSVPLVFADPVSVLQEPPSVFRPVLRPVKKNIRAAALQKNPGRYGTASWYSETDSSINRHTANGEVFDDSQLTCASWDYAFGTYLEVRNLANGKRVVCRVNDRGPSKRLLRLIDLTKTAFKKIADPRRGLVHVSVRVVSPRTPRPF